MAGTFTSLATKMMWSVFIRCLTGGVHMWKRERAVITDKPLAMAIELRPVIKSTPDSVWPHNEDRVEFHLFNWAKWLRGSGMRLGYPSRASGGIGISHSADFDQMADNADNTIASWVDAIIRGLGNLEQKALRVEYLGERWTSPTEIGLVLVIAREGVRAGLDRKGIV
jgi:hypothetical protein